MSAGTRIAIGDEVRFLNETGGGRVLRFTSTTRAWVRTWEGLEYECALKGLVKVEADRHYAVSDHQARMVASNDRLHERIERDKGRGATIRNAGKVARREDPHVMEIDLHLHELVKDERTLQHDEKLRYQLDYFERMLNTAIREKKRKLIVIHGIGEGVLREEVRRALLYYDMVRFDDADPRRYGYGATEVTILHH